MDAESQLLAEKDAQIERLELIITECVDALVYLELTKVQQLAYHDNEKDAQIERLELKLANTRDDSQDKDAEIERLKAELEASRRLCQVWIKKSANQDKLITECADALVYLELTKVQQLAYHDNTNLIQRAREATQ